MIVGAVLGSLLGLALLTALVGALVCCLCCRRRKREAADAKAAKLSLPQHKAGAAVPPAAGANGHHSPGSRQPSGQLHYDHYDTPGKVLVGTAGAAGLAAAGAAAAAGAGGSARSSSARSFNYYDSPQHLATAASSPLPPGRQQSLSYGRSSSMPVRAGGLAAAAAGIGAGAGAATLVGAGEAGATGGSSHLAAAAEAAARRPAYAESDSDDEQEGTRGGSVLPTLPTARASDPGPLSSSSSGGGGYFSKARLGAGAVAATGAAALSRAWGSNNSSKQGQLQPSAGASYGSEDLVAGLNEMKYIINNRLLLLVDDSTLSSGELAVGAGSCTVDAPSHNQSDSCDDALCCPVATAFRRPAAVVAAGWLCWPPAAREPPLVRCV